MMVGHSDINVRYVSWLRYPQYPPYPRHSHYPQI